ncbi:MAG: (2Fe-2S) ferredoxin domain-containing protein [Lachnospiraceae bacterium]
MKITICIGSSCHLKGSRHIVRRLQHLVAGHDLKDTIELSGSFCMGKCQSGVNVTVDGRCYSVSPDTVDDFFEHTVLPQIRQEGDDHV